MRAILALVVLAASVSDAVACPTRLSSQESEPAPVAVAFVVSGWEISMGNDTVETDEAATYPGMLPALNSRFAELGFAKVMPGGSRAAVITYADRAEMRVPMTGLLYARAWTQPFGGQRDYYGQIGQDLVGGVTLGLAQLGTTNAEKKFLVVIGDGNDSNNESATQRLHELQQQALMMGITPIAIVYKHALSEETSVVTSLDARADRVYAIDHIWPTVWSRMQLAQANATSDNIMSLFATTPACSLGSSRVPLILGSVLALLLMSGVWYIRREKPGHTG
jgi:hypothetical protein